MTEPTQATTGAGLGPIIGAGALGAVLFAGAVGLITLRGAPTPEEEPSEPSAAVVAPVETPDVPDGEADITTAADSAVTELSEAIGSDLAAAPETDPPAVDTAPHLPPRFDLVRVDPAGNAVIAGQAGASAEVTLTIDGEPVEVVSADASGQFVALLTLPPGDSPRSLTIESVMPDGATLAGEASVIIAPFTGEVLASGTDQVLVPPNPPPVTRADRPGIGEATSAAPLLSEGQGDNAPAAETAAVLTGTGPDAGPVAETAPPTAPPAAPDTGAAPQGPAVADLGPDPANPVPDTAPDLPATPPEAPAVFLADREGVRVLQSPGAPPNALSELQLDAISYDLEGEVTLAGRGPADSSVRVTLNNQPINLGEIGPGGQWSLDLPDVDPGTYTLRLEEVAADGTVTDEIETPFLREDPARIRDNPMLVDPGASVITVQRGFTLWGIAEANFGEGVLYVQIFDENRGEIRDPDLIFPGQIFALPDLPRGAGQ